MNTNSHDITYVVRHVAYGIIAFNALWMTTMLASALVHYITP